ncbi:MAG: hypothetical protein KAU16_05760 [Methanophagales archaeon]|nr:hypothetical protein [Methanophagales archaeon]
MTEEKLYELAQKRVDEFIQRLERYDRFRRSHYSLESATNWMLAISVGTLFWLLGSFDKFAVSDVIPNKSLFLLAVFFLGLSTIFFTLVRAILYLRQIAIDKALEDIQGLPDRVNLNKENKTEEELNKMVDRIGIRSIELWGKAHNLICPTSPLIKLGLIFYIGGLVSSGIYITIFVVKYV